MKTPGGAAPSTSTTVATAAKPPKARTEPATAPPSAASPPTLSSPASARGKQNGAGSNGVAAETPTKAAGSPTKTPRGATPRTAHSNGAAVPPGSSHESLVEFYNVEGLTPTTGGPGQLPPPIAATANLSSSGSSNEELNGSFVNMDLASSFHVTYSNKGDNVPNAKAPEPRRSRSVSPMLLTGMSPHASDDELVLICVDCGVEIGEKCANVMCPLTGKVHV